MGISDMNHFSELQSQHEELLRQESAGGKILEDVQAYIEEVRFKSNNVSSAQEREQLRANTRYWASYVYDQTGKFPNTELTPFSGEMEKEATAGPSSIIWIAVGGVAILLLVCLFAFILLSNSMGYSEETAVSLTKSAVVEATDAAMVEIAITSTPTVTPAPLSTPVTIPIPLQSLSRITSENGKEIKQLTVLTGHIGAVLDVEFNPNGQQMVSSGVDGTVVLWDISDGNALTTVTISQNWVQQSATYNTNGTQIAVGGNDRVVTTLDIADGVPFAQFTGHEGFIFGLDYTPDGLQLASGDGDGVLKIWDVYSGGMLTTMALGRSAILDLDFNQAQNMLAVANAEDGFKVLTYPSLRPQCTLGNEAALTTVVVNSNETVLSAAFANGGKFVVFGNEAGMINQIDPFSCQLMAATQAHKGAVNSVALNADGNIMVSGGEDGIVFVMPSGVSLAGHTGAVKSVAINPAGTLIASASADGTIILWGIPRE